MPDLSTTYIGLRLRNPVIAGASPLTGTVDGVCRCAEAGAGAVVLQSLFEEQLREQSDAIADALAAGGQAHAEAYDYLSADIGLRTGPAEYLELIRAARARAGVPIIASINCVRAEWWQEFAADVQAAGADALELNAAVLPTWFGMTGPEVDARYEEIVRAARAAVRVPLAIKLPETCSSLPDLLLRLRRAGADGFVLFNRFYMPTIDIEAMAVVPGPRFSTPEELSPTLRWISLLAGQVEGASFAAARGVHSGADVVRCILAGADAVQAVAAILRKTPAHIQTMLADVEQWLDRHRLAALDLVRGRLAQARNPDTDLFSRFQYMKWLAGTD
jgi:dihydroorotate dehydrogenase (fumarate)